MSFVTKFEVVLNVNLILVVFGNGFMKILGMFLDFIDVVEDCECWIDILDEFEIF